MIGYFPRTPAFCCEHREQGSHSTRYRSLHCKYLLWVKDYGVSLDTNELIFSPKSPSRISLPKMVYKSTDLEPLICSGLSSVVLAHLLWEVDSHEWISFSSTLTRYHAEISAANVRDFVQVPEREEALMKTVAKVGPLSVTVDASQSSFQFYESGKCLPSRNPC